MHPLRRGLVAALTLLNLPSGAPAASPPSPCPTAVYRLEDAPLLPHQRADDATLVLANGRLSVGGCDPARARIRRGRGGVRLTARLDECGGSDRRIALQATVTADCTTMSGTVRGGGWRRRFTAHAVATVPLPSVTIDPGVATRERAVPSWDDGVPRLVAELVEPDGVHTAFVSRELLVFTDDPTVLEGIVARWNGTVVATVSPAAYGLPGVVSRHVVRIETRGVDTARLDADLARLHPDATIAWRVSSADALATLTASIAERAAGRPVSLNVVAESATLETRTTNDGAGFGDAFQLGHLRGRCTAGVDGSCTDAGLGGLDLGVTEAWRALAKAGRLGNRVAIGVVDGGFFATGTNLPGTWQHLTPATLNMQNPTTCGGAVCPWHGTNVAQVAAAVVDDGIGIAGTGGPVATLVTDTMTGDMAGTMRAVLRVFGAGARIINMSFRFRIPSALVGNDDLSRFEDATRAMRDAGALLIAAAGNDGEDVDHEICVLTGCWEERVWAPCENEGVLCVGGLDPNGFRHASSNYGSQVELYAPYTVVAGPDPAAGIAPINGTSFSAPYVAGIAALMWAANPAHSALYIEGVLRATARPTGDPVVGRKMVDAHAAVVTALGGTPPEIRIAAREEAVLGACRPETRLDATITDPDGGPYVVTWLSDVDGVLGTGTFLATTLSPGVHTLSARVTDPAGFAGSAPPIVHTASEGGTPAPSTITITAPTNSQQFAANQYVTFQATGHDPHGAGGLVAQNLRWVSSLDGELGTGTSLHRQLRPGFHIVHAIYGGACGGEVVDFRTITVRPPVVDAPPTMVVNQPRPGAIATATTAGTGCFAVQGYGYDEEDHDFVANGWWEVTGPSHGWAFYLSGFNGQLCLPFLGGTSTSYQLRLVGFDRAGNFGYAPAVPVAVVRGVR